MAIQKNYVWTPQQALLSIPNGTYSSNGFLCGSFLQYGSSSEVYGATRGWAEILKSGEQLNFNNGGYKSGYNWVLFEESGLGKPNYTLFQFFTAKATDMPEPFRNACIREDTLQSKKTKYLLRANLSAPEPFGEPFTSPSYIIVNGARYSMFAIEWSDGKLFYINVDGRRVNRVEVPSGANVQLEIGDAKISPRLYNFLEANELFKGIAYGATKAYSAETNAWLDPAYKDIKITNTSGLTNRDEFAAWLKANAAKQ